MKEATFKKWPLISWEPEILISGGLILTLIKIQPFLNQITFTLQPFQLDGTKEFLFILSSALGSLTIGFILHLMLRALWLMKMGVASAFSEPLDLDKFQFSSKFEKRIANMDIRNAALRLGRVSSLVFSVSIFFLLISLGFVVISFVLIGSSVYFGIGEYAFPIILGLFILLLFDFITFGYLKRTQVGSLFYPVLAALYVLSLSFLYRDVYYHLIQNIKKRILVLGFLIFVATSMLMGLINISEIFRLDTFVHNRYDRYIPNIYDDERKPYSPRKASISSYFQDKDVIRLFIYGHNERVEEALDNDALLIKIDGQVIAPFKIQNHTTTENHLGYLYFLNISHVITGTEHKIEILTDNDKLMEIPFYKE